MSSPLPPDQIARIEAAHAALARGHGLENQGALDEALKGYDEAIGILSAWPAPLPVGACRDLGIAWMNRGNVLQRRETPEALRAAEEAYVQAIRLLEILPLDREPGFANSLGAAWLNRGRALHRGGNLEAVTAAADAYAKAISYLRPLPLDENPCFRLNLAGAYMNRANVLVAFGDPTRTAEARLAAKEALVLVAGGERSEPVFADLGLKARRAQCDAIGQLFSHPTPDSNLTELRSEASDAVDEGLALAREWDQRGLPAFRPLAARLFRYGVRLYARFQPHFVAEFIIENVDPEASPGAFGGNPDFLAIAAEGIDLARAVLNQSGMITPETADAARLLETSQALTATETRLHELRRRLPSATTG